MAKERRYTREEMMAKPVSRIQMYANRNVWNYQEGSAHIANHDTARRIFEDYRAGKFIIKNGYFTPKTNNTMPKKKSTAKASSTVKKAQKIYAEQKETYTKLLKTKVRQGKKVTTAAKEASKVYKEMYGATPTTRWKRALREAKHC